MIFITDREYGRKGIDKLEWRLVWIGVVGKIGILVGGSVDRMVEWQGETECSRPATGEDRQGTAVGKLADVSKQSTPNRLARQQDNSV